LTMITSNVVSQTPKFFETVPINGKGIYYEVYGKGEPLILLHGYTQSSVSWKPYIDDYRNDYEIYVVDLTGHGKSDPFKNDLSVKSVAQDLNYLIKYLKLEKVKAIGFSFGGDVLFQLALLNPMLIESMISIGAVGSWTVKDFPQYQESFTFDNRDSFHWLKSSHASDEHIKALMDQFKNYIVNLSNEELKSIRPEVLIMLGDDDEGMNIKEVIRVKENLMNSDLWILPNVSHGAHEGNNKEEFIRKSKIFFNKERN